MAQAGLEGLALDKLPLNGGRAGGFAPDDIYGLEVWLRPETLGVNGSAVAAWENEGSGADALQTGVVNQPHVAAGVADGRPAVRGDGISEGLTVSGLLPDTDRTFFLVAKQNSFTANDRIMGINSTANLRTGTGPQWQWANNQAAASVNLGGNPDAWNVIALRVNAVGSMDAFINGGSATNFDPDDSVTTGTVLSLLFGAASSFPVDGWIAEVIVYDSALSEADRLRVLGYLGVRYPSTGAIGTSPDDAELLLSALSFSPAKKKPEWAEPADGDGALLLRPPRHETSTWEATVDVFAASRDAAQRAVGELTAKLQEAEQNALGIPLVWTPADSSSQVTFYVLMGEVTEIPITVESGYFATPPVLRVSLTMTCRPFGYKPSPTGLTDNFSTDTITDGLWIFDASSAASISVTGGQLVPSATGEKRLVRPDLFYDAEVTFKFTTGTVVTPGLQVILARLRLDTYLRAGVASGTSLNISKVENGVATSLASTGITLTASTNYWVRARSEGNKITAELFTSAPTLTSTPAFSATYTLTGAEAVTFGAGAPGAVGMRLITADTAERYDDFTVTRNVYKGTGPLHVIGPVYGVGGDTRAETRMIVTDLSSQSRDFAAWGSGWRYQADTDLLLTQPDLTATGFAGTSTTRAGSVSTNVWRGTLTTSTLAVCGTGNQPHVGTFRAYLRCYPTSTSIQVRLAYRDGDGLLQTLEWETPVTANAWNELDLGVLSIRPALLGTQRWLGQVEAVSAVVGDTLDVDYLELLPVSEGYARAQRKITFETSTTFADRDEFDQTAGGLAAKVSPAGKTWAEAGDAVRFTVETTGHTATRSETGDVDVVTGAYAVSGVANMAATAVQVDYVRTGILGTAGDTLRQGVMLRYLNTTNWLMVITEAKNPAQYTLRVLKRTTADGVVELASVAGTDQLFYPGAYYSIRALADAVGRWFVWYGPRGTLSGSPALAGSHVDLATGGTLASGKPGFYDAMVGAAVPTRNFDNFMAFAPVTDAVCYSGRTVEFRSDGTYRQDPTGVYYGELSPRGAPLYLRPDGAAKRGNRIALMLRRSDIGSLPEPNVTDAHAVQLSWTEAYLNLPR